MVAETNRAPFDLPEAENELIAGYHTEYSSMKFAVFFMGEYAAMLIFSAIFSTIFLGGYDLLPLAATEGLSQTTIGGLIAFGGKMTTVFTVFIWIRATLPRLRYDQLMAIGWRYLLPIAVANFIVVAVWILYGWVAWAGSAVLLIALYLAVKQLSSKRLETGLQTRSISMVQSGKGVAPAIEAPIQEAPAN
jgi:NADH-quinone oxidoreductase subunit H